MRQRVFFALVFTRAQTIVFTKWCSGSLLRSRPLCSAVAASLSPSNGSVMQAASQLYCCAANSLCYLIWFPLAAQPPGQRSSVPVGNNGTCHITFTSCGVEVLKKGKKQTQQRLSISRVCRLECAENKVIDFIWTWNCVSEEQSKVQTSSVYNAQKREITKYIVYNVWSWYLSVFYVTFMYTVHRCCCHINICFYMHCWNLCLLQHYSIYADS